MLCFRNVVNNLCDVPECELSAVSDYSPVGLSYVQDVLWLAAAPMAVSPVAASRTVGIGMKTCKVSNCVGIPSQLIL